VSVAQRPRTAPRLLAGVALLLGLAACAINPVTGERQLALISEAQEIQMGQQVAAGAEAQLGLVDDPGLQAYVNGLGQQIAAASERPDLPWRFGVIDDPAPNAFAAPGGYIYVTRGLLTLMRSEAELFSVLGHEVGHVTARHSVTMMSRAQLAQIGLGLGSVISPTVAQFSDLAASGLQLLFLSYGRDAERQADDLGFRYAVEHGYDVREMTNVFAVLRESSVVAGQSPMPVWLSSHPYPDERIKRINQKIARMPAADRGGRVGQADFLGYISGLTYGVNPRNGFFEENRFSHPDLAFRMDMPRGWRTQNTAQAVVAGSPAQDAIVQLTLAQGSATEVATAFFRQQGMATRNVRNTTINRLPAVVGEFEADSQQGRVGGIAAFITLGERTYQILAYTPATQRATHDAAFRAAIGSFAPLTDRAALARQPQRVEIITVPRAMTLEQLNQAYPSSIPMVELALINHLQGPQATVPQGYLFKRVSD